MHLQQSYEIDIIIQIFFRWENWNKEERSDLSEVLQLTAQDLSQISLTTKLGS